MNEETNYIVWSPKYGRVGYFGATPDKAWERAIAETGYCLTRAQLETEAAGWRCDPFAVAAQGA